jgi:hypothetical protein
VTKKKHRYVRPFKVDYYTWGHTQRDKGDRCGFAWDLAEAYGNASRHLGRGSIYYRAIITDTEIEKPIAILTRSMGKIDIKELTY